MLCRIYFFVLFSISVSGLNQYPQKYRSDQRRRYSSSEDKQKISPYNDVIKNITTVNNVLEELIDNYAKLKNMYHSQETLSEYSSDMEIDPVYKMKMLRAEDSETTTRRQTHLATEMFLSEEDPKGEVSDEASDVNSNQSNQKEHSKEEIERETTVKTQSYNVTETEREANVQYLIKNEEHLSGEDDIDNKLNHKNHQQPSTNKKMATKKLKIHKPESSNSKKDNLDTSEMTKENDSATGSDGSTSTFIVADDKDSDEPEERVINPNMTKNAMNSNSNSLLNNQIKAPAKNASNGSIQYRTVKQVIKAEEFSNNNIWHEVVHKPVNLNTENEMVYKQPKLYFRTQNGQKENKPGKESLEDEKVILKEQFKTRILRKAYGDACLKVVVKKCYKACKEASKITCRKYKCKAEFKAKFLNHAKTGCIKEFSEVTPNTRSAVLQEDQGFHDVTRNGYLAAACLPTPRPAQITRRSANVSLSSLGPNIQLNILRDRFERACQEASAAKCTEACRYALKQTCSSEECKGNKKTAFDKACRKQCKLSYKSSSAKSHDHSSTCSSESSSTRSDSSSSGSSDVSDSLSDEIKTGKKKKMKLKKIDKKKDKKKKSEKEKKKEKKKAKKKEKTVKEKEEKEDKEEEKEEKKEEKGELKEEKEEEKEEKEEKKEEKGEKKQEKEKKKEKKKEEKEEKEDDDEEDKEEDKEEEEEEKEEKAEKKKHKKRA